MGATKVQQGLIVNSRRSVNPQTAYPQRRRSANQKRWRCAPTGSAAQRHLARPSGGSAAAGHKGPDGVSDHAGGPKKLWVEVLVTSLSPALTRPVESPPLQFNRPQPLSRGPTIDTRAATQNQSSGTPDAKAPVNATMTPYEYAPYRLSIKNLKNGMNARHRLRFRPFLSAADA